MKPLYLFQLKFLLIILFTGLFLFVVAQNPIRLTSPPGALSLKFAPPVNAEKKWLTQATDGSTAYGNNVWTNDFFSFNVDDPTGINTIGKMTFQTASGDFAPNDDSHIYVLDINTNYLGKIDISDGETVDSVFVGMPLNGGIWTVLTIHKSSGNFYAVATNGSNSNVYKIDPVDGATTLVFNTSLPAVISGTFDSDGNIWFFEIVTDDIYKLRLSDMSLEYVGSAGFNGNYAQGMGYDSETDAIYLATYQDSVGPQLRMLNRITGEATYLADLPGETTAFGFPSPPIQPIEQLVEIRAGWSGISSYLEPELPMISDLFGPLSDHLTLLQDIEGSLFWPEQGINTL